MTSVLDALPLEGHEVLITGLFSGERKGYYELILAVPVWTEAVDGPDVPITDVTHWAPVPPPVQQPETPALRAESR